jgi:hypothetical protein
VPESSRTIRLTGWTGAGNIGVGVNASVPGVAAGWPDRRVAGRVVDRGAGCVAGCVAGSVVGCAAAPGTLPDWLALLVLSAAISFLFFGAPHAATKASAAMLMFTGFNTKPPHSYS